MNEKHNDVVKLATRILREKLASWQTPEEPVWRSTWPVFERLIEREDEMAPVYRELGNMKLSEIRLWLFLEQCILAAAYETPAEHARLREDYKALKALNAEIAALSLKLADKLESRSELVNRSGQFEVAYRLRITELIEAAGSNIPLYGSYVSEELRQLDRFDLKYWPDVAGVIREIAAEPTDIGFTYASTEAIVAAKRASRTDFLREFFDRMAELSDGSAYGLMRGFRLTNASLATLINILCDVAPDDIVDEWYVNRARQRLREQGFQSVW